MKCVPKPHWTLLLWNILWQWLFLILLPAQARQNTMPEPPATYYGLVQAGSGFIPTAGMTVTAWISETLCGKATTQAVGENVVYSIDVEADWATAPGCGAPVRRIVFQMDGRMIAPAVLWDDRQLGPVALHQGWQVYLSLIVKLLR